MTMLSVDDIHTFYGESHVLQGVSIDVSQGEVVALLGRNGVGKTTTLRSVLGHTPPQEGTIYFRNQDITGWEPHDIADTGIGWVPEERRIFSSLTVEEQLNLAIRDDDTSVAEANEYFPTLERIATSKGKNLSGGELQMLAIARGFLGNFDLLLIDEPTEGLAPMIVDDVTEALNTIRSKVTILLVEQNVDTVRQLADRIYFIRKGKAIAETDDLEADDHLIEKHLKITE
jgi:branched-chain amino acid transport system ATP-binding protein